MDKNTPQTKRMDKDVQNLRYWSEAILETIEEERLEGVHFTGGFEDVVHNLRWALDELKNKGV